MFRVSIKYIIVATILRTDINISCKVALVNSLVGVLHL